MSITWDNFSWSNEQKNNTGCYIFWNWWKVMTDIHWDYSVLTRLVLFIWSVTIKENREKAAWKQIVATLIHPNQINIHLDLFKIFLMTNFILQRKKYT